MFPEKVDKVVLDGNVNVHEYYSGLYGIPTFFSAAWMYSLKS
jgi:hypothetical protein